MTRILAIVDANSHSRLYIYTYTAPAGDETLEPKDAVHILEEILPAQNHSYVIGMKLNVPPHVVEAIHSRKMEPERYLLKILSEFLNEVGSRPTWRVIVEALRSPAVRLYQLANKVEAAHFPDATSTREVIPSFPSTSTGMPSLLLVHFLTVSYNIICFKVTVSTQSPASTKQISKRKL